MDESESPLVKPRNLTAFRAVVLVSVHLHNSDLSDLHEYLKGQVLGERIFKWQSSKRFGKKTRPTEDFSIHCLL